jgi:hypothetical protein
VLLGGALGSLGGSLAVCFLTNFYLYLLVVFGIINPLMLWLTYSYKNRFRWLQDYVLAMLLGLLLGGLIGGLRQILPEVCQNILLPLGCLGLCGVALYHTLQESHGKRLAEVSCMVQGEVRHFAALRDTGNCLTEGKTGLPVCIVSAEYITLWQLDESRMEVICYETLAGKGELPVFPAEHFFVKKDGTYQRQKDTLLGFGPGELFRGKDYQMILHRNYC